MQQSGLASNALTCTPCICERWLNRQQLDSQKQDEPTRPHRTPHTRPAVCKSAIQLQICNQVHWLQYVGKAQWSPHGVLIAWHTKAPRKTRCSALYNDMILKITMHQMHTAQMSNISFRCLRHKCQTYTLGLNIHFISKQTFDCTHDTWDLQISRPVPTAQMDHNGMSFPKKLRMAERKPHMT